MSGATESTLILARAWRRQWNGVGDDDLRQLRARIRSVAGSDRMPWVAQAYISVTPSRISARSISTRVLAVSISSSTMIARLPLTSPMTLSSSAVSRLPGRRFSMIARAPRGSRRTCARAWRSRGRSRRPGPQVQRLK
jgi:hypothetical protein